MYMCISYLSREGERPNRSDAMCDGAADGPTPRIERHVVHVAPRPILSGLERPHDRVTGPAEVRGGVLVLRVVAAADVPARHAEPQVDPRIADPQAILTTVRAGRDFANLVPMRAFLCHTNPAYDSRRNHGQSTGMGAALVVLITTFLASAVEASEMVTIVLGVGATRGWRATLVGSAAGFGVLAVVVAAAGLALRNAPIGPLRLIVGALLLVFGLQWFRKGVMRVAAHGLAGMAGEQPEEAAEWTGPGIDWTAFVLAFKGVVLEGLEVAFIVVAFGASAGQLGAGIVGGVGAIVVVGGTGLALHQTVRRIPRSFLQLIVGILLTTFGSFWSLEGLGVNWPASDGAILGLLVIYVLTAVTYITMERNRALGLSPAA